MPPKDKGTNNKKTGPAAKRALEEEVQSALKGLKQHSSR